MPRHFALRARFGLPAVLLVLLAQPPVQADMTVRYDKTDATLVLFGQPQEASFIGDVGASVYLSGTRVRVDAVDFFGTPWHIVGDRDTGAGFLIDSTRKMARPAAIGWRCEQLPVHTARWFAHFIRQANADSILIRPARSVTYEGSPAHELEIDFRARLFGAPQAARSRLTLIVPADEEAAYGAALQELYCGTRPPSADWARAFQQECTFAADAASELAAVVTLPFRIIIETDMGIGQARVVLDAVYTSFDPIAADHFVPPDDFARPSPAE